MLQDFKNWASSPFSPAMSVVGWFLFFGLVFTITGLWKLIFDHIKEA